MSTTREFKSREVAQAPIYVIVHTLLELSFCIQPFPTPSGWLCRCMFTLVIALWRSINFVLLLLLFLPGKNPWWLKNYKRKLRNLLEVNPTLAGRHQRNHHVAKPN